MAHEEMIAGTQEMKTKKTVLNFFSYDSLNENKTGGLKCLQEI